MQMPYPTCPKHHNPRCLSAVLLRYNQRDYILDSSLQCCTEFLPMILVELRSLKAGETNGSGHTPSSSHFDTLFSVEATLVLPSPPPHTHLLLLPSPPHSPTFVFFHPTVLSYDFQFLPFLNTLAASKVVSSGLHWQP